MRRTHRRPIAVLVVLGVFAAGCSKPAKQAVGTKTKATAPQVEAPVTLDPAHDRCAAQARGGGQGHGQEGHVEARWRHQRRATTRRPGPSARCSSPSRPQRRKPLLLGRGREHHPARLLATTPTSCGVNVVNAVTAAGGALPSSKRFYRAAPKTQGEVTAQVKESIDLMVRYWNDHAFEAADYAPEIRKLMGNDPKNQFFGRHLVGKIIDGGSNQCPDKTTAAAKQAANEDHAFVVFNDGATEGASPIGAYNMAAALNTVPADHRPMHFGTLWLSDQDYTRFAPFAWTQFSTGSTITRAVGQLRLLEAARPRCGRRPGADRDRPQEAGVRPGAHQRRSRTSCLANEFKGYLNQYCGGNIIAKEVEYDGTNFRQGPAGRPEPHRAAEDWPASPPCSMLTEPDPAAVPAGRGQGPELVPRVGVQQLRLRRLEHRAAPLRPGRDQGRASARRTSACTAASGSAPATRSRCITRTT